MLHAVDQDDRLVFDDPVDDPIRPAARRMQALELTDERFAAMRVVRQRPEDGLQSGKADLAGKPIQVTETLRRDLDFVHEERSDPVAQRHPLSVLSLYPVGVLREVGLAFGERKRLAHRSES